jgi:hypothetical protein
MRRLPIDKTSSGERSSMGISRPDARSRSKVERGAATYIGMPCVCASTASVYVPILFATSPLAAMRSAPTITDWISPRAIKKPAMPSVSSVTGTPRRTNSYAVTRAPCRYGRVSSANTRSIVP